MSEYMTLLGAEDVRSASHNMQNAASEMTQAANNLNETITFQMARLLDDFACRMEAIVERIEKATNRCA